LDLSLTPLSDFDRPAGPVLLVIADGLGLAPAGPSNAVTIADTPVIDALLTEPLSTRLVAHGVAVGLPSDEDMGNSEVGHNALGAGRVFAQGAKLVNRAIETGTLFESPVWRAIVDRGQDHTVHFVGLHSDGNVHSHNDQLYRLMVAAAEANVCRMRLHILLDGRDTAPRSALEYIGRTEAKAAQISADFGTDVAIASGGGRMAITMDRYEADWAMVKRGYWCHTHGVGLHFASAAQAVEALYEETDDGDQYLAPFVIIDDTDSPVGTMADGDAVVFFNFRGDRAIEISRAYEEPDFDEFDRGEHPDVYFAGMLQYDGDLLVPANYLVDPPTIDRTMGEYLAAEGVHSFAISETQKYGHVTYFWNGNRSGYIDEELETYVEIPSDNIEFDRAPAMKAREITAATAEMLRSGRYRFGRLNFANGDMVGHTGNLAAAAQAISVVDECLGELLGVIDELDGVLVFTADHGNADIMFTEVDGQRVPKTSHTLSPVPFVIHDLANNEKYRLDPPADAGLSHVAATLLNLLGYAAPDDYQPSLIGQPEPSGSIQ
jgi:2,3-bisphosphoglycerate-independent phosphoglycerate mutase